MRLLLRIVVQARKNGDGAMSQWQSKLTLSQFRAAVV
jgi:hypothetical protein